MNCTNCSSDQYSINVTCANCGVIYNALPHPKPLTDEQIEALYETTESANWARSFARAIEAAHGIKGEA